MSIWLNNVIDAIVKDLHYPDKESLFRDYGIIPSVLTPKHKKSEFIKLLCKYTLKK